MKKKKKKPPPPEFYIMCLKTLWNKFPLITASSAQPTFRAERRQLIAPAPLERQARGGGSAFVPVPGHALHELIQTRSMRRDAAAPRGKGW
jgi:hypothetical protein